MTFGARLRNARHAAKLTQRQLAEKIGAKHNSVSNWENDQNKPDPDTIELLCGILSVNPSYFFTSFAGINSEKKEEATPISEDGLTEEDLIYIEKIRNLSPEQQKLLDIFLTGLENQ